MDTPRNARYRCLRCERPFDRKDALSRHMQLHEPGRPAARIRRKSCISCFKSKTKCSGTRPICALCEKRGSECRYLKDSGSLPQPDDMAKSQSESSTQAPRGTSNKRRQPDGLFPENDTISPNFGLPSPEDRTCPTSFDAAEGSRPQILGAVSGSSVFSYLNGADYMDQANDMNWFGEASMSDNAMVEPFIPGLWDFSMISPLQTLHPSFPLPPHSEVQDSASARDGTDRESSDGSEFEHPWPMDWNPGSTRAWSLPMLEGSQNYKSVAKRTFCNKPITASGAASLTDRIKLYYDWGPWQQIQLENFPSCESLNHAIDMYFVHFHGILPMIHHPTFDPEHDFVITLCVITIGVKYTGFPGAQNFSKALFELTRRLLISRAERERRFVRTETYLIAQLLQAVCGYLSDDERTFEMAESCRSSLVYNAKCMGLFRTRSAGHEFEQGDPSPDEAWHAWIRTERLRRIAWSIFELDTSCAYLHNNRPLLSPDEIKVSLPGSSRHWEAQSAHAWASLHPWASTCPPEGNLRDTVRNVIHGTGGTLTELQDEKHRFLVVLSLVRTLWSVKDVNFCSIIEPHNEGFESALCTQQQEMLLAVIDRLHYAETLPSKPQTRSQQLQAVYRAQLTHTAHLFGAGDLLTFLYAYLRHGHNAEAELRMRMWAERDAARVRRVAYHCAQLLALMRKFPSNLPAEPFVVFHAGVILSIMCTLLPASPASSETSPLQIDFLDSDGQQTEKTQAWIKNGGEFSIWVHGVTSLTGDQGREQVLDQTAWLLSGMNVWPIAKKFATMVVSLR